MTSSIEQASFSHGILVSPCFSTHASVHMASPLESLRISNVAARFNTDGYAKALGARGAAWKSPAVCAPGYVRPARGTLDELLMYDAEPLPCSLVKLPAEVAAKVCLPLRSCLALAVFSCHCVSAYPSQRAGLWHRP